MKKTFGPKPMLWPMPALLVGAMVGGRPNFMTAAWGGVCNAEPAMVGVALRPQRHTFKGVHANMAFSLNVPSTAMASAVDYCGIVSGAAEDKAAKLGWTVFFGTLASAPLIEQCPANIECEVAHLLDLGTHIYVIGRVVQVHVTESCLTDEAPDPAKIDPLVYVSGGPKAYTGLSGLRVPAFSAGKTHKG